MPTFDCSLIRNSEWCEETIRCGHEGELESATCIYRRTAGESVWQPWVIVAPSALLKNLGYDGLGLYAARPFKKDDIVGRYGGRIVEAFDEDYEHDPAVIEALLSQNHDKLLLRKGLNGRMEIVDGSTDGPPYLMRCNDPKGSRLKPNGVFTEGGYMRISQHRVPSFNTAKSIMDNIDSELRVEYGDDYWECW